MCEICSKLTIKTPEQRQWRRSGVFIVNFEHISHLVLVFLLLTLSRQCQLYYIVAITLTTKTSRCSVTCLGVTHLSPISTVTDQELLISSGPKNI